MKIREAWRQAWAIYRRSPSETFRFLLLELVLRLMALTPLLFLTEPALRWGALLSPVLFVLIVLPARANAAEVMQAACRGKRLFTIELVSFKDYGAKIAQGLKMAALLLLWSWRPSASASGCTACTPGRPWWDRQTSSPC